MTADVYLDCYGVHRHLHSFPTRRSSDLDDAGIRGTARGKGERVLVVRLGDGRGDRQVDDADVVGRPDGDRRSEEHTSELQSQSNLVCRLLLEKKKMSDANAGLAKTQHYE